MPLMIGRAVGQASCGLLLVFSLGAICGAETPASEAPQAGQQQDAKPKPWLRQEATATARLPGPAIT